MPPRRVRISTGIYRDVHGISAIVRVRPLPPSEKRYPHGTAIREMQDWRDEERARLLGEAHRPERGSLAADVRRYLALVRHLVGLDSVRAELKAWVAAFGDRHRSRITTFDVLKVRATWLAKDVAPKTVNNRVARLARVYRLLDRARHERRGDRAWTPCDGVDPLPVHRTPAVKVATAIVVAVEANLRAAEASHQLRDAKTRGRFMVLAASGKRPSELMRAQPPDVDLERRVWTPRDGKGGFCPGVYLNDELLAAWQVFLAAEAWGAFNTGAFSRTLRSAGWPKGIRVYNLRHATGIELSERGHDLSDIKEWLGHRRLETTRRHYVPVVNSRLQRLSEALDHRFGWAK